MDSQSNENMYYTLTDHLGSLNSLIDDNGNVVEEMAFDIHMLSEAKSRHLSGNGRVYCTTMQFVSPDPFIQSPEFSANYNRYSYVLNSPLNFTDPSGYTFFRTSTIKDLFNDYNHGMSSGSGGGGSITPRTDAARANAMRQDASGGWRYDYSTGTYYNVYSNESSDAGDFDIYHEVDFSGDIVRKFESIATHRTKKEVAHFQGKVDGMEVDEFYTSYSYELTIIWMNVEYTTQSQGGAPGWASDANTGVNAFMVGNGAKTELLDYTVRTNYKSARTASQFNKLRPTQQAWRTTNTLGKTGAQYLKYAKGLGYVGAGLTTTYSAYNAGSYYYNGGTDWQVGAKATLDVIMTGVGFLGPIGFGISATYFIVDAAGGFGDFGEIKP